MNTLPWTLFLLTLAATVVCWMVGQNRVSTAIADEEARLTQAKAAMNAQLDKINTQIERERAQFVRLHSQIESRNQEIEKLQQRLDAALQAQSQRQDADAATPAEPDAAAREQLILEITDLQLDTKRLQDEIVELKRALP